MAAAPSPRPLTTSCHLAAWIVAGLVCAGAAIAAAGAGRQGVPPAASAPERDDPERRVIEVVARRFAFEPAVVHVVAGVPVRLLVRSADGVHGIGIDALDIERRIPRGGEPVAIDFVAPRAGRFPIVCSEYCGAGHEEMRGTLVVQAAGTSPQAGSQE